MATASIVLTTTFQKVSDGECFMQLNGPALVGFGNVSPTTSHTIKGGSIEILLDINYNGNYGAVWLKKLDNNTSSAIVSTI